MAAGNKSLAEIFGANILLRRKRRNLSQEKLAELVGISQQSLSRMENGHIAPKFERLQDFANALGCSLAALFEQTSEEESDTVLSDIIRPLSADSQKAIINIVLEMAQAMLKLERG